MHLQYVWTHCVIILLLGWRCDKTEKNATGVCGHVHDDWNKDGNIIQLSDVRIWNSLNRDYPHNFHTLIQVLIWCISSCFKTHTISLFSDCYCIVLLYDCGEPDTSEVNWLSFRGSYVLVLLIHISLISNCANLWISYQVHSEQITYRACWVWQIMMARPTMLCISLVGRSVWFQHSPLSISEQLRYSTVQQWSALLEHSPASKISTIIPSIIGSSSCRGERQLFSPCL